MPSPVSVRSAPSMMDHPVSTMSNIDQNTTSTGDGGDGNGDNDGPHPTDREVIACQFSSWYSTFSNLSSSTSFGSGSPGAEAPQPQPHSSYPRKNVTIKSIIIGEDEVPQLEFRKFLLSDGVKLPTCSTKLSSCATMNVVKRIEDLDDDDDDDDNKWTETPLNPKNRDDDVHETEGDDDENDDEEKEFEFPHLTQHIKDAIKALGGAVMPKLNWSSPKDATWINEGTMKCQTPGDVYLLLKSSDFCLHDVLGQSFHKNCPGKDEKEQDDHDDTSTTIKLSTIHPESLLPQLQIVLRKWRPNLHPSMEFRCFVRNDELIAISQRHHSQHYPHLMNDWTHIRDVIDEFYEEVIWKKFGVGTTTSTNNEDDNSSNENNDANASQTTHVSNFVFDVYVDQKDRVWIIDFNPWSSTTDSLLYDWTELLTMDLCDAADDDEGLPRMKIVQTARQVRQDPLSSYRAPIDAVELASMTHGDSKEFEKFMKRCQQQTDNDTLW